MTEEELWESVTRKHIAAMARANERMAEEGVSRDSVRGFQIVSDEIWNMVQAMTPEERREHRQASELGCLPGDTGGGWDVLYVPDDGKDH